VQLDGWVVGSDCRGGGRVDGVQVEWGGRCCVIVGGLWRVTLRGVGTSVLQWR
jgi:hypothetical protein